MTEPEPPQSYLKPDKFFVEKGFSVPISCRNGSRVILTSEFDKLIEDHIKQRTKWDKNKEVGGVFELKSIHFEADYSGNEDHSFTLYFSGGFITTPNERYEEHLRIYNEREAELPKLRKDYEKQMAVYLDWKDEEERKLIEARKIELEKELETLKEKSHERRSNH